MTPAQLDLLFDAEHRLSNPSAGLVERASDGGSDVSLSALARRTTGRV